MAKTITLDAKSADKLAKKVEEAIDQKPFEIVAASLKDDQCNYGYEIKNGINEGDKIPSRKGSNYIHDDLREAFNELDVFLAHIDGAFKSWAKNQTPIQDLEADEELGQYSVGNIKIVGVEENKSVILTGSKFTEHGLITFSTPKIKLEGTYLYLEELQLRLKTALEEVEAYMNGKKQPEPEQTSMEFDSFEQEDAAFEAAKVN